jgi:hypothetical protein
MGSEDLVYAVFQERAGNGYGLARINDSSSKEVLQDFISPSSMESKVLTRSELPTSLQDFAETVCSQTPSVGTIRIYLEAGR